MPVQQSKSSETKNVPNSLSREAKFVIDAQDKFQTVQLLFLLPAAYYVSIGDIPNALYAALLACSFERAALFGSRIALRQHESVIIEMDKHAPSRYSFLTGIGNNIFDKATTGLGYIFGIRR